MKSISGKDLAKLLELYGWIFARVNGSHHIYVKEEILSEFLSQFMVIKI